MFNIFRVLAKHDALFFMQNTKIFPFISGSARLFAPVKASTSKKLRDGQKLANALVELGPTFIKLGQALSVRADIIGDEVASDLSFLQDDLPPFNGKKAISVIESELGEPIDKLFKNFDEEPIAAASIAQVHFAEDFDGNKLAVKVLRPGIEKLFTRDIDLFYWIADNISSKLPKYNRLKLVEAVKIFEETAKVEMDLSFEAAAASRLLENFKDDPDIKVPKVYWKKTTNHVLTLERLKGIHIDDISALKRNKIDPHEILRKSANIFMKQTLRDGFFHADMHPGNVLIDKDGRICVFDFGIMGNIDRKTKIFLAEMLLGFLNRDYQKVADVHFEAGYIPKKASKELFAQACRSIGEPIFDLPQNEISIAKLLRQLFRITEKFNMETQPQLLLLQKSMMMAEGLGRKLNPNVNFWELSRELIEDWGRENLGPKARVEDGLRNGLQSLEKLHSTISNLNNIITEKGILIHPKTINALKHSKRASSGNKFFFAAIIALLIYTLTLWQIF